MRLRRLLFALACVAALVAMGYGQYCIRLAPDDVFPTALFLLAALAAALLLGWGDPSPQPLPLAAVRPSRPARFFAGIGLFLGIVAVITASVLLSRDWAWWFAYSVALVLAGVTSMSVSLRAFDPPKAPSWERFELIALLAIVALGAFLRFYHYTDFPAAFSMHAIEEPQAGNAGFKILHEHMRPWEFMFDQYLTAAAIYLTDDPSILTVRIPFTVFSILTIIPVYLLLRQLVSRPAALAGTFLFAVSSWNIIYSRAAHNIFLTNCLVVLDLSLLVSYARTGRLTTLPWIGLLSGYTLYAYAGYRGTTLLALLFLGMLLARHLRGFVRAAAEPEKLAAARAVLRDLFAVGIVTVLAVSLFVPIIIITTSNKAQPYYYFEAANRSLSNKQYYTNDTGKFFHQRYERLRNTARIFMHHGDDADTFNYPGEPMLDPLTSVLFVGGLILAACFPWRRFNAFFLFTFVFLLLGGAVFVQNLDVRRLQGVTPFVALFAALFVDRLWLQAQSLPAPIRRGVLPLLAVAGGLFALGWNYNVYFNKMSKDRRVRQAFKNQYTTLIEYGRRRAPGREILLLSDLKTFFQPSDYYWMIADRIHGEDLPDLSSALPPAALPHSDRPISVVIQLPFARQAIARLLAEVYPGTRCSDFVDSDNPYIAYTACDLPPHPEPQPYHPYLHARYWFGPSPEGTPFLERDEPFLGFAFVPRACYRPPPPQKIDTCTAEWRGTLQIAAQAPYVFVVESRRNLPVEATVDGTPITAAPMLLAPGPHEVVVSATFPREAETGTRLSWQTPAGLQVVPFYTAGALFESNS